MNKGKALKKIFYFITVIILVIVAIILYGRYTKNNFNDFVRTEYKLYTSEFSRDRNVRYSKADSYKIQSNDINDAMFYKTVNVNPNTPYKVTCMVKTENVKWWCTYLYFRYSRKI